LRAVSSALERKGNFFPDQVLDETMGFLEPGLRIVPLGMGRLRWLCAHLTTGAVIFKRQRLLVGAVRKKFFFLWPLATATAAALGPVPPPFAPAAFFAMQQRSSEKL
jgi:hypothetical protein